VNDTRSVKMYDFICVDVLAPVYISI